MAADAGGNARGECRTVGRGVGRTAVSESHYAPSLSAATAGKAPTATVNAGTTLGEQEFGKALPEQSSAGSPAPGVQLFSSGHKYPCPERLALAPACAPHAAARARRVLSPHGLGLQGAGGPSRARARCPPMAGAHSETLSRDGLRRASRSPRSPSARGGSGTCRKRCRYRHEGAGSDGHLAHVFRHTATELFHEDIQDLAFRAWRTDPRSPSGNKHFQEVTLERSREVLLRFAAAYGFRNIQNVTLKLRKGTSPYHFVEVLVCPGGSLNGRGQAQPKDGHADQTLLRQMEGIYSAIPMRPPESSTHVQELYQEWLQGADTPRAQAGRRAPSQGLERRAHPLDIKW
ncbi:Nuclear prelamin A recognition factor [Tupaia chinensis]|uniref:Nuclear prelamin A recognition factor n=1 Tax=Tupaia chinensis TaxID=246437 RepID=L9L0A1_TUPCH|nr:Nuclear prelamin A recognition factor [Tupaia chinensis]